MSQATKYTMVVSQILYPGHSWHNKFQVFIQGPRDHNYTHCLGIKNTIGSFLLSNPDHYKANSIREIVGIIKSRFKNVKKLPQPEGWSGPMFEGEL